MNNRIRGILFRLVDDAHMLCTLNALRRVGNDQLFGRITVNRHPEGVPEDGHCGRLIPTTRMGHTMLQEGIRVVIIDGHHRHAAIGELRKYMAEELNWTIY